MRWDPPTSIPLREGDWVIPGCRFLSTSCLLRAGDHPRLYFEKSVSGSSTDLVSSNAGGKESLISWKAASSSRAQDNFYTAKAVLDPVL